MEPTTKTLDHEAALSFLYGRIDYERMSAPPYPSRNFKLDRMHRLLDLLGNPQQNLKIVHVAGTKGKGSTAAMISAIFSAAGYRAGLYTSPHLDRLEERLAVDAVPCTATELVDLVACVRPVVDEMDRQADDGSERGPTYFEITTAMALLHFARRHVDAAVLEVGLGGRLDSTNVCTPMVSVITSISFDHMAQLGNSLAAIAGEKAGIIKPGVPVVSGVVQSEPHEVIARIARQRGSKLLRLGEDFDFNYQPPQALDRSGDAPLGTMDYRRVGDYRRSGEGGEFRLDQLTLPLLGKHQASNAAVALTALSLLEPVDWQLPEESLRRGLAGAHCPARVETVARRPTVVIDAAHNVASVEALVDAIEESFLPRRRVLVFATTMGKDVAGMFRSLLPHFEKVILTRYLNNPRGIDPHELACLASRVVSEDNSSRTPPKVDITVLPDPTSAFEHARQLATAEHLICVTGSFFIAAETRQLARQASAAQREGRPHCV